MVKFLLSFLLIMTCTASTPLQSTQIANQELPSSYKIGNIKTLIIENNAAWSESLSSSAETQEDCANFKLSDRDVRDYFRRATHIEWVMYDYLPYSRCYASGTVVFGNGDRGTWLIDRNRRGKLTLSDGRLGYFYGKRAHARMFEKPSSFFDDPLYDAKNDITPKPKITIGTISSIIINRNTFRFFVSEEQKSGLCKFDLSEKDIKEFFLNPKILSQKEFGLIQPDSCHLEGEVVFTDGRRGTWMIEQGRRGVLEIPGEGRVYLYGKDAQAKAFKKP